MAGFFLLGILLGMLGTLVIIWHYHIDEQPRSIGFHFLGMGAGFVVASLLIPRALGKTPVRTIAILATTLALLSLLGLSWLAPPAADSWRIGMLTVAGVAAGSLTYSLFYANQSRFESAPATAANYAGALFVGGGLLSTAVVGSTYFGGSIQIQPLILAFVPAIYLILLLFNRFRPAIIPPQRHKEDILRDTLKDLRSIATLLFSLLIFFQFACEWAIASWLPLFLIHTLGINPVTAIWALGLYFLALIIGRLLAQILLPIVSHRKMLLVSVAAAMAGYVLLTLTDFTILALIAAVIIGLGHAAIYPLIAERLDDRFSYHPGFYSGAISFAMVGAMATPWLLGYVADDFGMRFVMLIPAIASVVVLVLSILIMLESRLMGGKQNDSHEGLLASDM
jgi:fucose permease